MDRVVTLRRRGHLTIFDSTHNTNVYGYNLFTFMVRNEFGTWIPGTHALVELENSDILSKALRARNGLSIGMRYFLTDDSAVEQLAVKMAFPGLIAG
ncbi:hypothetical protein V1508DRAFT_422710 [Lipomyces doorenjongii]|uniref:uncharacterized protein n=1 Tax=Lipomyces doorenjongii TaxID=383834 RepID=UPI0034CF9DA5